MEKWNGRVAMITGAGGGIGSCLCRELLQGGMKIVALDQNWDALKACYIGFYFNDSKFYILPL